jgi:hypothetical protein
MCWSGNARAFRGWGRVRGMQDVFTTPSTTNNDTTTTTTDTTT